MRANFAENGLKGCRFCLSWEHFLHGSSLFACQFESVSRSTLWQMGVYIVVRSLVNSTRKNTLLSCCVSCFRDRTLTQISEFYKYVAMIRLHVVYRKMTQQNWIAIKFYFFGNLWQIQSTQPMGHSSCRFCSTIIDLDIWFEYMENAINAYTFSLVHFYRTATLSLFKENQTSLSRCRSRCLKQLNNKRLLLTFHKFVFLVKLLKPQIRFQTTVLEDLMTSKTAEKLRNLKVTHCNETLSVCTNSKQY